jgi:hypothetical protein
MKLRMLMLVTFLVAVACAAPRTGGSIEPGQAGETDHPLLEGLERPPQNSPLTAPPPIDIEEQPIQLPDDSIQALLIVLNDAPFSGKLEASGSLEVSRDAIELETSQGALRILYRTPPAMERVTQPQGEGNIGIEEFSDAEGANRLVVVRDRKTVLLAEVWQSAADPLEVSVADGLRLVQRPAEREGEGYTEARLDAFDGSSSLGEISIGEPSVLQTEIGPVQVFVETSHLFHSEADEEDEYILHVWIVGLH